MDKRSGIIDALDHAVYNPRPELDSQFCSDSSSFQAILFNLSYGQEVNEPAFLNEKAALKVEKQAFEQTFSALSFRAPKMKCTPNLGPDR